MFDFGKRLTKSRIPATGPNGRGGNKKRVRSISMNHVFGRVYQKSGAKKSPMHNNIYIYIKHINIYTEFICPFVCGEGLLYARARAHINQRPVDLSRADTVLLDVYCITEKKTPLCSTQRIPSVIFIFFPLFFH